MAPKGNIFTLSFENGQDCTTDGSIIEENGSTLTAVLLEAIERAGLQEMILPTHLLINGRRADDAVAFRISPDSTSPDVQDVRPNQLVVYVPACLDGDSISVERLMSTFDESPLVVITDDLQHRFLDKASDSWINFVVASTGAIAAVLNVHPFYELRGTGDVESTWICAPTANAVEVGEEELDPLSGLKGTSATMTQTSQDNPQFNDVEHSDVESILNIESTPELEYSSSLDYPADIGYYNADEKHPLWLFSLMGSFFLSLFNVLLAPFGCATKVTGHEEGVGSDDDETEAGARTPIAPTEQIPLLQVNRSEGIAPKH